jgi:hypothetical protein
LIASKNQRAVRSTKGGVKRLWALMAFLWTGNLFCFASGVGFSCSFSLWVGLLALGIATRRTVWRVVLFFSPSVLFVTMAELYRCMCPLCPPRLGTCVEAGRPDPSARCGVYDERYASVAAVIPAFSAWVFVFFLLIPNMLVFSGVEVWGCALGL